MAWHISDDGKVVDGKVVVFLRAREQGGERAMSGPQPASTQTVVKEQVRKGERRPAVTAKVKYSLWLVPNDGVKEVVAFPMATSEAWVKGDKESHLLVAKSALKPDTYGLLRIETKGKPPAAPVKDVTLQIWLVYDGKAMWKDELAKKPTPDQYAWNLNTMREKQVPPAAIIPNSPDQLVGSYKGAIEPKGGGLVFRVEQDFLRDATQPKAESGEAVLRWSPDGERYFVVAIPQTQQDTRQQARLAVKLWIGDKSSGVFPFQQAYLPVKIRSPRWWFRDMRQFIEQNLKAKFEPAHPLWMPDPRPGTEVKFLLDGGETYNAMVAAMETAVQKGHFIYIAGWDTFDDFNLDRRGTGDIRGKAGTTLRELLRNASGRGVMIRGLFWFEETLAWRLGLSNNPENRAARDAINQLLNSGGDAHAILDGRVQNVGSHHQKLVLVNGNQGLIAFAGGRDFHPNRVYKDGDAKSDLDKRGSKISDPSAPYLDLHLQLRGRAAYDLLEIFLRRYADHPTAGDEGHELIALRPKPSAPGNGVTVRVCSTFGDEPSADLNGKSRPFIPNEDVKKALVPESTDQTRVKVAGRLGDMQTLPRPQEYSFAPKGRQSGRTQLLYAITCARKYIYFEDQYMVSEEIAVALNRAIRRGVEVVGVIPHQSIALDFNIPHVADGVLASTRLSRVINVLHRNGADPAKANLFSPRRYLTADDAQGRNVSKYQYIHSKVFIFDDAFCTIGSMNFNRRSTTHDSELCLGFYEPGPSDDGFVKKLRMTRWARFLGLGDGDLRLLDDPVKAIKELWSQIKSSSSDVILPDKRKVPANLERYDWSHDQSLDQRAESIIADVGNLLPGGKYEGALGQFVRTFLDPVVTGDETRYLPARKENGDFTYSDFTD